MKFIYLSFVSLFVCSYAFSQNNHVSVEYATIISKLCFQEAIADFYTRNGGGNIAFLYSKTELNQPLLTSAVRLRYEREVGNKVKVGIWGRKIIRGLKSRYSYNIVPIADTASLSNTYGGFNLVYRLKSSEVGLSFDYTIFSTSSMKYSIGLNTAFDVYNTLEIKSNVINRSSGVIIPTEEFRIHFNSGESGFWERYKEHVQEELYRMGIYLSGKVNHTTIVKGLSLNCSLELGWSSPLSTKDPAPLSFLPDGWVISGSANFGISYSF